MDSNAFDLTWRNYFPSASQLCICMPSRETQPIQLPPDEPVPQELYNHQAQIHKKKNKRRQTDEGYVTGLESVISTTTTDTDQSESLSRGRRGRRSTRKSRRRHPTHSQSQFYEIYPEEDTEDARILEDQQMPQLMYDQNQLDDMSSTSGGYQEQEYPQMHNPKAEAEAIQAAQTLFTTKLVDLTDKLTFIKENMMIRKNENTPDGQKISSAAATAAATLAKQPEVESDTEGNDRSRARYSQLQNYNGLLDNTINENDTPNYAEEGWSEHEEAHDQEEPSVPTSDLVNRVMDIGRKWWSS
ncbi:hypothetical protein INT44_002484 [Umbelopsis vinacea]|uniref:Uncharacterized protein n=1 Tax=Umbelopsis vinacea TaxID=44442 RepID=A0A8H7UH79_9FUNG|nr:hypothetical protein INT44_002484 [Umbelopsis vinacea]